MQAHFGLTEICSNFQYGLAFYLEPVLLFTTDGSIMEEQVLTNCWQSDHDCADFSLADRSSLRWQLRRATISGGLSDTRSLMKPEDPILVEGLT